MTSYYNEIDKHAAAWLRELVKAGHIADGIVDERDIQDVLPSDLAGFTQCHFFAGIGVWSYALRNSGWADDRPVWTGSCPCQPFSSAGKGSAFADERHLWPAFHHLIKECRPPVVFGEQVASRDADAWIDLVQTDLEAVGYAVGAVPFPSASVGAPHIRDRLYWVGERLEHATGDGRLERRPEPGRRGAAERRGVERLADDDDEGLEGRRQPRRERAAERLAGAGGVAGGLADLPDARRDEAWEHERRPSPLPSRLAEHGGVVRSAGPTNGFWRDADWLGCRDGKWRPVEPGLKPLVNGAAARVVRGGSDGLPIDSDKTGEARVMRLRGYGNSINAVQAQAFVEAFMGYQQQVSA